MAGSEAERYQHGERITHHEFGQGVVLDGSYSAELIGYVEIVSASQQKLWHSMERNG
jgi:hypothetical protein